jgi:hypothetical protein
MFSGLLVSKSHDRFGVASISLKSLIRGSTRSSRSSKTSARLAQKTRRRSPAFAAARFHASGCRQ